MNNQLYTEFREKIAINDITGTLSVKLPSDDNHILQIIANELSKNALIGDDSLIYGIDFLSIIYNGEKKESELTYAIWLGFVGNILTRIAGSTDNYQVFLSKLEDDFTIDFIENAMKEILDGVDIVKTNIANYDYSFISEESEKLTKIVTDYITKRDNTYKEHEQLLDTLDGAGLFLLNNQVFSNDDLEDDVNLLGMECELIDCDLEYNTYSILPSVNSMAYPYFDLREGTFDKNKFDLELTGGYISDNEIEDGYNSYENYLEYIEHLDQVVTINNSLKDLIENYNNLREKFNLKVR